MPAPFAPGGMARVDLKSLIAVTVLFMLLNGGVLGLVHKSLTADVQPAARDWRIATLLSAAGSLLITVQYAYPPWFILPLANGLLFAGAALFWRAVQRFCARPHPAFMALPAVLGVAAVAWVSVSRETHVARVLVSSPVWAIYVFAAAWTLIRHGAPVARISRLVLIAIFLIVGLFIVVRAVHFSVAPQVPDSLLVADAAVNVAAIVLLSTLPVIGTTAFILMCSERLRQQWEHAAATDDLTGLPNRRSITATGNAHFNAARRAGQVGTFAVAVIDIDRFKSINDRFGHEGGDIALKHVARVLDTHCRGPSLVGRQGGEEFVALLDIANAEEARIAAERLRQAIESLPAPLADTPLPVTASIGVGVMAGSDADYDAVLQRADRALYAAKQGGRNRVVLGRDA
ncbi:MAG: GGDEF domain-containing protein [Betaproteobacteria bacterium]|nr:GGDEF domain-containing protein [Betaproteobacteria bacterium]